MLHYASRESFKNTLNYFNWNKTITAIVLRNTTSWLDSSQLQQPNVYLNSHYCNIVYLLVCCPWHLYCGPLHVQMCMPHIWNSAWSSMGNRVNFQGGWDTLTPHARLIRLNVTHIQVNGSHQPRSASCEVLTDCQPFPEGKWRGRQQSHGGNHPMRSGDICVFFSSL